MYLEHFYAEKSVGGHVKKSITSWFFDGIIFIGADFMFLVPGQKAPRSVETWMESRGGLCGMSP